MTEVIRQTGCWLVSCLLVVFAQALDPRGPAAYASAAPHTPEELYRQLRSAGLDSARVYRIRDASIDRNQVHITLEGGTIAFTTDVEGKTTGAFFEGEGEVLLVPPDQAERASMSLFTGAAILEEKFDTAYFRFNDDTFSELQPALMTTENGQEIMSRWKDAALNLAELDALRLLLTFSRLLPPSGSSDAPATASSGEIPDRFLHARVHGLKLGSFDLNYDSNAIEQISVGQQKSVEGTNYYDVWASFSPEPPRAHGANLQSREENNDEVVIPKYQIEAQVTPPTQLHANARFQLKVCRGGARAVLFELSRYLKVSHLEVDGRPVDFIQNQALEGTQLARRGNDILVVVFPEPLRAGQKMEVRFVYGGDVLSEAGSGLLYVGARGTWYPNRGLAPADFDLQFRYPAGWTLLATGKRIVSTDPASPSTAGREGERVSRWVTERPIPLAGFNLGKYAKAVAQAGATTVETYAAAGVERTFPKGQEQMLVPPIPSGQPQRPPIVVAPPAPSPAHNAQTLADKTARAVEFYAQRFGPFPYSSLAITQMPGLLSQGWPGLIFLSSYAFLTPDERSHLDIPPVNAILYDQVTAHETAHQWWGDLIFWQSYRDQWVMEGLANYCSLMRLQSESPAKFRLVMQKYREDLLQKNKAGAVLKDSGPVTLGLRLSSSQFPDGYEAISYGRGTWLFHMLRSMLKDAESQHRPKNVTADDEPEPFVHALRRVRERYAGKSITTRQLIEAFAEELPPSLRYEGRKSLDWFDEGWVNGTAMPRFQLQGVKFTPKGSSVTVSGMILQKNAPKDLVTSVPLYGALAGERRVFLGRVFADGPESAFRLTGPAGVHRVLIDPEQTVLTSPH